jgi:hypothetical protein
MPSVAFKRILARQDPGLDIVDSLAGLCRTSLTATAIRYAELTDNAVAIIITTGPAIDFCILSDTIKSLPQLSWIRKGMPVPRDTATAKLNADPSRVANGERIEAEISVTDWLGGSRSVPATEQAVGLGSYGKTLTVLCCPSVQDEAFQEDDHDEQNLIERWTPRFRH